MKLSSLIETKNYFTEKLSDVNRNLSFAGIAIIWIFKYSESGHYKIPEDLILPVIFLILSLFLDLLQFIYGSIVWTLVFRKKEKLNKEKNDFSVSKIHANVMYFLFFFPKVVVNIFAYILIFAHLIPMIKS